MESQMHKLWTGGVSIRGAAQRRFIKNQWVQNRVFVQTGPDGVALERDGTVLTVLTALCNNSTAHYRSPTAIANSLQPATQDTPFHAPYFQLPGAGKHRCHPNSNTLRHNRPCCRVGARTRSS